MTQLGDESLDERFEPFAQEHLDDPHALWKAARDSQLFFSDRINAWVLTRHRDIVRVLQDPEMFRSGGTAAMRVAPPQVQAILDTVSYVPPLRATDEPLHTRLRKPAQAVVAPRRIPQMEAQVRSIALELTQELAHQESCDFYRVFAYRLPLYVISSLLGFPRDANDTLHHWANSRVALAFGQLDLEEWKAAAQDLVDFHQFIEGEIVSRQAQPRTDMLSDLVHSATADGDPLTLAEMVEEALGLVTAGHETIANWLSLTLYHLLSNRALWDTLIEDPDLIPATVEETIRFDSPNASILRIAAADTELDGTRIRAGDLLFCVLASANRDHAVFDDPARLAPGRADIKSHLAFGRGSHACIGAGLARLEGRVAFEVLTSRLPDIELVEPTMHFATSATLRIPRSLMVRPGALRSA